jgi:hypothetical protein
VARAVDSLSFTTGKGIEVSEVARASDALTRAVAALREVSEVARASDAVGRQVAFKRGSVEQAGRQRVNAAQATVNAQLGMWSSGPGNSLRERVADTLTNVASNPSVEVNLFGLGLTGVDNVATRSNAWAADGAWSLSVTNAVAATSIGWSGPGTGGKADVVPGSRVTVGCTVHGTPGQQVRAVLSERDAAGTFIRQTSGPLQTFPADGVVVLRFSVVVGADCFGVRGIALGTAVGQTFEADAFLIVEGADYQGPFFTGSIPGSGAEPFKLRVTNVSAGAAFYGAWPTPPGMTKTVRAGDTVVVGINVVEVPASGGIRFGMDWKREVNTYIGATYWDTGVGAGGPGQPMITQPGYYQFAARAPALADTATFIIYGLNGANGESFAVDRFLMVLGEYVGPWFSGTLDRDPDGVTAQRAAVRGLSDTARASDAVARGVAAQRALQDAARASEALARSVAQAVALAEQARASEQAARSVAVSRATTDAAPASDTIKAERAEPFADYIRGVPRRFLARTRPVARVLWRSSRRLFLVRTRPSRAVAWRAVRRLFLVRSRK